MASGRRRFKCAFLGCQVAIVRDASGEFEHVDDENYVYELAHTPDAIVEATR